jgi:hypothetical protein
MTAPMSPVERLLNARTQLNANALLDVLNVWDPFSAMRKVTGEVWEDQWTYGSSNGAGVVNMLYERRWEEDAGIADQVVLGGFEGVYKLDTNFGNLQTTLRMTHLKFMGFRHRGSAANSRLVGDEIEISNAGSLTPDMFIANATLHLFPGGTIFWAVPAGNGQDIGNAAPTWLQTVFDMNNAGGVYSDNVVDILIGGFGEIS